MRCLYCNKKLSLLKLAKGDSFCSSEHFDAHQLQLSKNAFDRLMSLPSEDAPKAPLAKTPEEAPRIAPQEEKPPVERVAAPATAPETRPPASLPPPMGASLPMGAPLKPPPPYAPFASQQLPPFSPDPPTPVTAGAGEPVEPERELAFPVHEVEATVCILNLYLQLGLAGTEPIDWLSERDLIVTPEDFRLEMTRPTIQISPEFPEMVIPPPEEPILLLEASPAPPVESPVSAIEAVPIDEDVSSIKPVLPAEPTVLLAPVELEATEEAAEDVGEEVIAEVPAGVIELASAPAVEAVPEEAIELVPAIEIAPEEAIEAAPVIAIAAEETIELAPAPAIEIAPAPVIEIAAELHEVAPEAAIAEEIEIDRRVADRVPFLVAPSFRERAGSTLSLNASIIEPHGSIPAPILDLGNGPQLDCFGPIPPVSEFAAAGALRVQNSACAGVESGPELPMPPTFAQPAAKEYLCVNGWRVSNRIIGIARRAAEAMLPSTRALDFDLPAPAELMLRPDARAMAGIDPQQLLHGTSRLETGSVFVGVLETRPCGKQIGPSCASSDRPESGLSTTFAAVPAWTPVSSSTWLGRTTHLPLAETEADWLPLSMLPLAPIDYLPGCAKVACTQTAELPAPWVLHTPFCQVGWPELEVLAASVAFADSRSIFIGLTILPPAAPVPEGRLGTSAVSPVLTWEARTGVFAHRRALKFLPMRNGAMLPSARHWQRRDSVPT